MNVIARLEYELVYYDSAVHRFNHYTTMTPPWIILFAINAFLAHSEVVTSIVDIQHYFFNITHLFTPCLIVQSISTYQ